MSLLILLVGLGILSDLILQVSRSRVLNTEQARAVDAARDAVEALHEADFFDLFRLYNPDPGDDPGGPGTAPGTFFAVAGLTAPPGRPAVGRIAFPTSVPDPASTRCELREDLEDRRLGMPRDLDLDGQVDALDHGGDYCVLPFLVEVEWQGSRGRRSYRLYSMLSEARL